MVLITDFFSSRRVQRYGLVLLIACLGFATLPAQDKYVLDLPVESGEYWWGGLTSDAGQMPFPPGYSADLRSNSGNQAQPLLLSSHGRYIWCDSVFRLRVTEDRLELRSDGSDFTVGRAGKTLASAYRAASERFFPFQNELPDPLLFTQPQYNTWIELIYNQNQADILAYARAVIDEGFAPGVLMIDDNWQADYGDWRFRADRFPDPKGMVDSLHAMGFKVMVWICPFVSPDSEVFRYLYEKENALLLDPAQPGEAKMVRWWNGFSALLDLTSAGGEAWLRGVLDGLQSDYGIDGFKLDGGDFPFYYDVLSARPATPAEHAELYARIGLDYALNEYRACWKLGGRGLAQRLRDKSFAWDDLRQLIPGMTFQGLMGYPFACPDMIGGGEYRSFLALDSIDQELIVRSAQVHALMPMMQFSVAPWRVLDAEHLAACRAAAQLHTEFGPEIMTLARAAAQTGEPIVSPLAYHFPDRDYEQVTDQFMLGREILVAPVVEAGQRQRTVRLPPGRWRYVDGQVFEGARTVAVEAPLAVLPYFWRIR
jgi:alpha-glucosidase